MYFVVKMESDSGDLLDTHLFREIAQALYFLTFDARH